MNASAPLSFLLSAWIKAKEDERQAIEARRNLDKMIVEATPPKDEGTYTDEVGGYKVSVSHKMDRKVDADKLGGMWQSMSEAAQKAFKWKADVSITELRKLQEFRPDDYAFVAGAITVKPASPSVTVELIKPKE